MDKPSIFRELEKLGELRDKGILTEEEFIAQKEKLLNGNKTEGELPNQPKKEQPTGHPTQHQPSIVIQQTSTPSASSSAAAAASSGDGFWGTLFKIVGGIVVLSVGLAMCMTGENSKKTDKPQSSAQPQPIEQKQASPVQPAFSEPSEPEETPNKEASESGLEAKLTQAKSEYKQAELRLNKVWKDMDADVRDHLKREQVAWNRDKESSCSLYAKENGETQQERELHRLECWTEKSERRTSELIALEKELLPKIQAAQKEQLEKSAAEAIAEIDKVHASWSALPDEIKQQLQGDFAGWKDEVTAACFPKGKDSVQDTIRSNECVKKAAKKKLEEINGYKI